MLEIHYNNPLKRNVNDSSGVRLHLTSELRSQEAGIFVAGVAVSPLHLVPPRQKAYATAGYCSRDCTHEVIEEDSRIILFKLSCLNTRRNTSLSLINVILILRFPFVLFQDKFLRHTRIK